MAIKLYDLAGADLQQRFSPYCWRVRLALAHKELEVETIPWRFQEKEAIAFSGQGKVPVIVDKETPVSDSWEIAEYLERTYPDRPSLFGCPQGRSQARFIKFWDEKVLTPPLLPLIILDVYNCLHEEDKAYFRQTREKAIGATFEEFSENREEKLPQFRQTLAPLRETVKVQPFLGGDRANFADYIIFGRFQFARCASPFQLLESDDPIYAWRDKMLSLYDGLAGNAPGYTI